MRAHFTSTFISYTLSDGTGAVDVRKWLNRSGEDQMDADANAAAEEVFV